MDTVSEMQCRRFVLSSAGVFLVLLAPLWLWVALAPMAFRSTDYPIAQARLQLIAEGKVGRLCVFGDSTPLTDFVPSRLGPDVSNFAVGGGSPIEAYYLAKRVMATPVLPRAVILSVSPYHMTQSNAFWNASVPWGILTPADAEEARRLSRDLKDPTLFGGTTPGDIDTRLKLFLYAVQFPAFDFPALLESRFYTRLRPNRELLAKVLADRGQVEATISPMRRRLDFDVVMTDFVPSKIMDAYFDRTIALLSEHQVEIYFIRTPHSEVSEPKYWPGLGPAMEAYLQSYAARYPHFHILGGESPTYPMTEFADQAHLHPEAAAKWSDHVADLLNAAHAPGGPYGPSHANAP